MSNRMWADTHHGFVHCDSVPEAVTLILRHLRDIGPTARVAIVGTSMAQCREMAGRLMNQGHATEFKLTGSASAQHGFGGKVLLYSADTASEVGLMGQQHSLAWIMNAPYSADMLTTLQFGLRLGPNPTVLLTRQN